MSFDSQSLESGSVKRERKGGLLMHAFIPTVHFPSLVFFPIFLSFLSVFFSCILLFFLFPILSFLPPSFVPFSLFMATPFYTIYHCGIYHFYSLTAFGSLWVSLQDYPLACRLPSHYLYSECVGCTTLHSQAKLLVMFLTPPCFCFTYLDKD